MNTVLLVDDESAILQMLGDYLKPNYNIKRAINGKTAIKFIKEQSPDLIVLDWMLPDIKGPEVAAWIRGNELYKDIPIIMLTAKSGEHDKLKGFDAGADDYMVKPFLLSELQARIKALLKRSHTNTDNLIKIDNICLNLSSHEFSIDQQNYALTSKEFKLMKLLMKNPKRAYSREQLISLVWGDHSEVTDRAVDVCVSRFRKILKASGSDLLKTIRGVGYRLINSPE
ncbi:MAG: response regulator [Proteobacteria bacterium]|nr:response regulator [Pseudomonadota bacterium]